MIRVKSGETDKLGLLYERYKKAVFAYFFKLSGGGQQLSEDLVQTVFLRILKYKKNYKGTGKFTAWLFSIARNVGLDHYKRKSFEENIDDVNIQVSDFKNNVDDIIKHEQQKLLRKALMSLRVEEREVLVLGKLKELSYKDVGKIIGCTESNVKIRIHRALKSLRAAYFKLEKS